METFLSATALVWCGLITLIMIGIIYLLKRKKENEKDDLLKRVFYALYITTLISITTEIILQHAFVMQDKYPLYTQITSKFYISNIKLFCISFINITGE